MKKILIVSHCILNNASKLKSFDEAEMQAEDALRREVLKKAIDSGVQLLQLPCPEYLQYGYHRWGHTMDQFNNVFFRSRCREMLQSVVQQLEEYLANPEEFQILGVLGVDGSPSCGVKYTCRAKWGGEFSGRSDLSELLGSCRLEQGSGVLMSVLREMLKEKNQEVKFDALFAPEAERAMEMLEG